MRLIRTAFVAAVRQLMTRTRQFPGKYRAVKLLGRLAEGAPIGSAYGVVMEAHFGDLTNYYAIRGYDDHRVAEAVATLRPGEAFIDVGANAGLFSLLAAKAVGPAGAVLAFEPQAAMADLLRRNRGLNRADCIHVFEFALGVRTERTRITRASGHSGIAFIDEAGDEAILVVDPADMKALFEALVGERGTMIKIDVEGYEAVVVRALAPILARLRVRTCIVEIDQHNLQRAGSSPAELYQMMESAGFRPVFGPGGSDHYDEVFERDQRSSTRRAG